MTQNHSYHSNLGDILQLPAHGERSAIVDLRDESRARELTAFELDALCDAVGRGLLRRGIQAGARVGILAENRVEFVAGDFGIMRMGAVAVPVNHKLPRATIAHIFRDSGIEFALSDAARRPFVPDTVPTVNFDSGGADGFDAFLDPGPLDTFVPDGDALAEILYTSGSTGVPKGVPLTHSGQLWATVRYLEPIPPALPQGSTIVVAPLYHMNGLFNITVALANRLQVILLPRFDARRFLETLARYHCSFLSGIPTMYALMVRERDLVERLDFGDACRTCRSARRR